MSLFTLLPFSAAAACLALAALVVRQAGRFVDRWAFVAGMVALAADGVLSGVSAGALTPAAMADWQQWRHLALAAVPVIWLLFSVSYSRDDRRLARPGYLLGWGVAAALPVILFALQKHSLFASWHQVENEDDLYLRMHWPAVILHLLVLVGSVAVLMNLERTSRASVGTLRWRIKYLLLGVGIIFAVRLFTSSQAVLFHSISLSLESTNAAAVLMGCGLSLKGFCRPGHFETRVYPAPHMLRSSLTAILAGVYLLVVGVLAKVVPLLGGAEAFVVNTFLFILLLALLAVLSQSDRLRARFRLAISRYLHRPVYDYRMVWRQFTANTVAQLQRDALCRALVKQAAEVFQALSVTIWLVDETRSSVALGASTSLREARSSENATTPAEAKEVIEFLRANQDPVEYERKTENWAAILRRWHPLEFKEGGSRICVPIISQSEMLGLITLGDRVGGVPFQGQDFDLLKCIADHTAASLLNVRLSERLLEAKEMESFQKMAAFFVHDLKNAASTLSLMLKNLPVHFENPEFRADALRGLAKTVSRINDLTGRLNNLRHELTIHPIEFDLNGLIAGVTSAVPLDPNVALVKELSPLPPCRLDRHQIEKVLVNLLLNAVEAISGPGELKVSTHRNGDGLVLAVADSGCSMSADFLAHSLFRPFTTTKQTGLGIGMFHCKAIIDAHGGRITVSSEPGKGTEFRVFLPLQV